mgnify:CR=1 FL=1
MARFAFCLALLWAAFALLPGVRSGFAAESQAPVALVTGGGYAPFTGRNLPGGGMFTKIVRAIYAEMTREVAVSFRPWRRGYMETRDGTFAATFPYIYTSERAAAFHYSKPVWHSRQRLMVMADSPLQAKTVADLAGHGYCNPLGYTTRRGLEGLHEAGKLERETPSRMQDCLRMLARDRVDFVPIGILQGRVMARDILGDTGKVRFIDVDLPDDELHVLFPRNDPKGAAARDRFDAALKRLRARGDIDAIVRDYLTAQDLLATN